MVEPYPHLRVMPSRNLIAVTYETIAVSNSVQNFQLITAAKSLLSLVEEISTTIKFPLPSKEAISAGKTTGDVVQIEVTRFLNIFSTIFDRIVSNEKLEEKQPGDNDELSEFLKYVWDIHIKGSVKLMNTTCPAKILFLCPERLDDLFENSLSSLDPLVMTPYCEKSKDLFMKVMHCLSRKFLTKRDDISSGEHGIEKDCLVEYSEQLICILQTSLSRNDYHNLYPSVFHTILSMEKWISDSSRKYFENVEISEQLFTVVDVLVEKCVNTELYNFLPFFIAIHPNLNVFLRQSLANEEIRFKTFPYLWQFSRKYLM